MTKADHLEIPGVLCRHETREVDVPLTPDEWAARSEEMALTLERVRLHEEYAAQVRKFLASEKEKINHELQKLGSAVTRHAEPREMPVAVFVDVATGRTLIVRDVDMTTTPPTGLVHSVKAATPDDLADANRIRQMPLGLPGQGRDRLRVVPPPSVGAPPTMPDLGGSTGAAAGEKVVVLVAYNGSNPIRGTAALANAFKLPVTECRKLLHALSLGVQVIGGRLAGAQLTMGVDQLRMADFSLEIEDPVEGVPDIEVEVELTDAGENSAAVLFTLTLMLGLDELTARRLVAGAPAVITRLPLVKAAELVAMIRSAKGRAKVLDEPQVDEGGGDEGEPQGAPYDPDPTCADVVNPGPDDDDCDGAEGLQAGGGVPWSVDTGGAVDDPATLDEVKNALEENTDPEGWGWVTVNDCGDGKMGSATAALRELGFARAPARAMLDKIAASSEPVVVYTNPGSLTDFPLFSDARIGKASIHEVAEKLRAAGLAATAVKATSKRRR